jgi:hypothetical protein
MPRTPEQQQALLAQMREAGAGIRQNIAEKQKEFDEKSIQRGYAFRQGLAETAAQRALTPAFGTEPSSESKTRGAQALAEAERWRQAQAGRSPMSREPFVFGVGASAFSYTPFAQRVQLPEESSLGRFTAAINPARTGSRFRPFPFGMRRFGVI